jgi:hypothetical protein
MLCQVSPVLHPREEGSGVFPPFGVDEVDAAISVSLKIMGLETLVRPIP